MTGSATPESLRWRKSTFSAAVNCVEIAALPDGGFAMRNSSDPQLAITMFTRDEMDAFFKGVKDGEFDDLV